MKYRLKNKELQRKLDEISNGNFSTQLQDVWSKNEDRSVATFDFGDYLMDDSIWRKFTATIYEDEIEEVPEYDPTKWNEWPDVTPPVEVPMRCEIWIEETPKGAIFKGIVFLLTCLKWDGSAWRNCRDGVSSLDEMFEGEIKRLRFRPWVDPDEEGKE